MVRWSGGQVVRWSGDQVVKRSGDQVVRWVGGQVKKMLGQSGGQVVRRPLICGLVKVDCVIGGVW